MSDQYDTTYRLGDAITLVLRNKPYIDLSIPPSSNDYQNANCATVAIYDNSTQELLIESSDMIQVPNRPGWYYYRLQTQVNWNPGLYTAIFTVITKIDGIDYTNRSVQEFRLLNDGIL